MRIRGSKDFCPGLVFVFFGAVFIFLARNHPMGSAIRMGPAYFPTILGSLLVAVGLVLMGRGVMLDGEHALPIKTRSLVLVFGAVVMFGFLLRYAGLIPAVVVSTFLSALGGNEFRFWEVASLAAVLVAGALLIFHYGLGLPFALWPKL
jgi:hypothetical protein